jgi:hypothetical protein
VVEALVPSGQRVRLGPLSEGEGAELLERWLQEAGRTLQLGQREAVAQRLSQCGLPLYVRGVFQEVRSWASYDGVPRDLAADTAGLLRQLFDRLEERRHHSPVLVRISLGYLAAGRHGLTEDELLDVLSADRAVMQDFHDHSPTERGKPATERLPPIVWSRLRFDLADYLAEREADGTAVLAYFHREISEVVRSRCLQGQDLLDHQRGLARYFGEQVLDQADSAGGRQFNRRKLAELPYQQSEGELWPELLGLLAGDFAFLRAKTEAGQVFDLVEDYNRADPGLSEMPAFAPWSRFVRGQAPVLALDPELFFQQVLNEPMDSPVSRAADERVGTAEAPQRWLEWVNRPREFMPPACLQVLTGHTGTVESVAVSADGRIAASAAGDQTVRVWDLATGQCRVTLTGHTSVVRSVAVSADGRTAVSEALDVTTQVVDAATGQCLTPVKARESPRGGVPVWDLATGQCRAVYPWDSDQASSAWARVRTERSVRAQVASHGVELLATATGAVVARFPGSFTVADCSPDGRLVVAGNGGGQVYCLRLRCRAD